ncbi:MAG: ABC transporter substrate-binding protein [Chloroflexi bacterium]|nr:ABC transporter substrate-binding protein [Chloroflexota bacterium]MYE40477.1 ABC transporter substrate-binding protein [Chloroflexota bacterium]
MLLSHRVNREVKPAMRPTGWLAFFGLMLALSLLLGCTREVVKEVIVTPVAGPTATSQTEATAAPVETSTVTSESETENERPAATTAGSSGAETGKVYRIGIAEDLTTTNHWAYVGPDGTVWNGYVLGGSKPVLYGYSAQRFDWIPSLAADFPSPLKEETVDGQIFWTTELELVEGVKWSDGSEVTAEDFVFTAHTATELQLTGDWPTIVDPEYFDHAEANGPYSLKVYFKQKPGLARWQFGLAFMPIFSKSYWQPVVAEAKQAGDTTEQQKALYAHVPDGEPSAGGFIFDQWERGAFAEKTMNPDYSFSGTEVTQYANGAYTASTAGVRDFSAYGEPVGETVLEYTEGPYSESTIYSIYGSQDAAVLALKKGDIDFMLNPLGLSKGLQDQLTGEDGLTTIENASNGLRYLGFNFRKEPMDSTAFRQAVATLIDKEFLVDTVLQGVAIPIYTMVPEGNGAWYNPDVPLFGKGMTRQERIAKAVELLKEAGFTWETEPRVSEDGNFVEQQGEGLKMPNGEPVPAMEVMAPSPGYDPLRSTFAIWIERWLTEVGIPLRANLTGFNVIVDKVFNQQDFDMWILGWGLSAFPDYLENFFHSRHSGLEGHNPGGYNNPEFDRLADELLAETDLEAARQQVFKMQAFLAEDLPYVVLFDTPIVETYRSERIEFPYTETWGGLQSSAGLPGLVNFR